MGRTTFTVRAASRLLVVGIVAATTMFAFTGTSWAADRTLAAEELSFANKLNAERTDRGLNALKINLQLTGVARAWTAKMAADGGISHNPRLGSLVEGDWTRLGENVGYSTRSGTSPEEFVRRLHLAFMESPGHRANVLGEYNQVGIGVGMTGSTMWVTVNFMKAATMESNTLVNAAATSSARTFAAPGKTGVRAEYVVVTASDERSHRLAAAALAGDKAPVLYTHAADSWDEAPVLHPRTRAEIDRVLGRAGLVYVVGNAGHVSDKAVGELTKDGYTVKRLTAASETATVVRVAEETIRRHGANGRAVISRTADRKASTAAARWAAETGTPFLITSRDSLRPAVSDFLRTYRPAKRWVVGSTATISQRVKMAADARRISSQQAAERA